jgi:hypothetical protein
MDLRLTDSQYRAKHVLDRATQDDLRKRTAVRSIDNHISIEDKIGHKISLGKPTKSSDLSTTGLDKVD